MKNIFSKREKTAFLLLFFLFLLILILYFLGWLVLVPFVDNLLHFLGGFFVALFFIDYFRRALIAERSLSKDLIIIIGASLLVGVGWEIFEFILSHVSLPNITLFRSGGLFDTLKDLVIDSIGAMAMFFVIRHRHHRSELFK